MKYLKCDDCKREAWVSDDCRMCICPICMREMLPLEELERLGRI